ncbi:MULTISPECIES: HupE/UreJ family protein [Aminobacter]|jgi:urease accessory protein|uniref:Urease accessory protein n=2 Tax=Aminobacter TaxID=31988 RepID=A0AAC8YU44_AMIAI|nr:MULTISPECIES: HupE/UreJ family protein [Aminobacter]AMS44512.1 urease accessory protein [Aminobacter aminovorans]MBA8910667.1 urease accessory protein [Aminobacter ciceronei]MBA9024453.1 urease accessory protein [Aminobacter ciceronei]MBB3704212.1 urease accessory protein [Aminobacter aminovorans]MRX32544.1 urease accessory protein [Aminobacter sp. MDW-2]
MNSKSLIRTAALAAFLLAPGLASAHTGIGHVEGFAHGFAHPLGGLDHVLAMVMVGLFAAQLGGRARWLVPASFVSVMILGGALGLAGIAVPFVELGIGLSIVVLGGVVAFNLRAGVAAAMALVGFFAVFHGYAHGAEMPESASGLAYGAGFVLATAMLHAAGLGFGLALDGKAGVRGAVVVRSLGALAAFAGIGVVTGLV